LLRPKPPELAPQESDRQVRKTIEAMLDDIGQRGEMAIRELAPKFDQSGDGHRPRVLEAARLGMATSARAPTTFCRPGAPDIIATHRRCRN